MSNNICHQRTTKSAVRTRLFALITAFLIAATGLSINLTIASAKQPDAEAAKKLFETKCSECHTLDYPRSERHDLKGWTEKIERMRSSYGCKLTDKEAESIAQYLTKTYGK